MLKKQGPLEKVNISQGNYDSYRNFPQHTHIIDYVWQKIQWKELRLSQVAFDTHYTISAYVIKTTNK